MLLVLCKVVVRKVLLVLGKRVVRKVHSYFDCLSSHDAAKTYG